MDEAERTARRDDDDADGSQLILSNHVSQSAGDSNELEPAVNNVPESIGKVNKALADAGYVNADAIERLQEQGRTTCMWPSVAMMATPRDVTTTVRSLPRTSRGERSKILAFAPCSES